MTNKDSAPIPPAAWAKDRLMGYLRATACLLVLPYASALSVPAQAQAQTSQKGDFSPAARRYCELAVQNQLIAPAIRVWATDTRQDIALGENYQVTNWRVKSFVPWEEVICAVSVKYDKMYGGRQRKLELRDVDFRIWGNDDATQTWVETYRWPNAAELKIADNAFNRAMVIDGETFEQARVAWQQGRPKNLVEALSQSQGAYNNAVRSHLRGAGVNVDAIEAAEREETRKREPACTAAGGTWGYPRRNGVTNGPLGCYFQTINK